MLQQGPNSEEKSPDARTRLDEHQNGTELSTSASSSSHNIDIMDDASHCFHAASQQAFERSSLDELFQQFQANIVRYLAETPKEDHRLTKAQFLGARFSESEIASDSSDITLEAALAKQAEQIAQYQLLSQSFTHKQQNVLTYLDLIRAGLNSQPVTTEHVRNLLLNWQNEINLSLRISAGQAEPLQSSPSSASSAETLYQSAPLFTGDFHAFIKHALSLPDILEKIVYEVRYNKGDAQLTEEDVQLAEISWADRLQAQFARLAAVDKHVTPMVEEWHKLKPQALTYAQMAQREQINRKPYQPDESVADRKMRYQDISGYEPRLEQIKDASIVQNLAERARKAKHPIAKQHCELPDRERIEMQFELGIRPFSKSRESYTRALLNTVTGSQTWQTSFNGARLDPEHPVAFPERRAIAQKVVEPFLQLRNMIHKKLTTPVNLDPSSSSTQASASDIADKSPETDLHVDEVVSQLQKMRL